MAQRLLLTTAFVMLALIACRRSAETTEAQPTQRKAVADPISAQKVARAFGHLKNARLIVLNKPEEPLEGHVSWALKAGPSNACWQCRRELVFAELALEQLPRPRAAAAFGHLKNAKLALLAEPPEAMGNHANWARGVSSEEFKRVVNGDLADIARLLSELCSD